MRSCKAVSWAVSAFALCALAMAGWAPADAFAQSEEGLRVGSMLTEAPSDESTTYTCANGWVLAYEVRDDGTAAITDVLARGSDGSIEIPDVIEGRSVTEIAARAFYNEDGNDFTKTLTQVSIPDSVTIIGRAAFMGTALTSIRIPAGVEYIPVNCFGGCADLAEVTFAGSSMGYFDRSAFSGCSSLKRLDVPELTKNVPNETYRIGRTCFYKCTGLETLVFHGDANTASTRYFSGIDCVETCSALKNIVYECRRSVIPRDTGSDWTPDGVTFYQTLAFYENADDAKDCKNPAYIVTCKNTVKVLDILYGEVSSEDIWAQIGTKPSLPEGKAWGVSGHAVKHAESTLADTHTVIPVPFDDLDYGWVYSDTIKSFEASRTSTNAFSNSYATYYIDDTGTVGNIGDLTVYGPSGDALAPDAYKLVFERATTTGSGSTSQTTWSTLSGPLQSAGRFRVSAQGASPTNAGSKTSAVTFDVAEFSPTVRVYSDAERQERIGRVSEDMAAAVRGNAKSAVVVPASDWRYQLIGAGLAGVGQGVLIYDGGEDYSSRETLSFIVGNSKGLQVVGSKRVVPESEDASAEKYLMDFLNERDIQYKSRYSSDVTVQKLADEVYTSIRRLMQKGNAVYGGGWGDVAVVASPENNFEILAIAQYAYQEKAPVFFVGGDGMLSAADLGYLKNDGFKAVVIAGGVDCVSQECAQAIAHESGITPTRLLDQGANGLEAYLASAGDMTESTSTVVIASTESDADVTAGAVLAAACKGTFLTCSCTADSKSIQVYLRSVIAANGQASAPKVILVGDFSNTDANIAERISVLWTAPWSAAVGAGDTVASQGFLFKIGASGVADYVAVRNPLMSAAEIGRMTYGEKTYPTGAMPPGLFSACKRLCSVAFRGSDSVVATGLFKDVTTLAEADLGSSVTSVGVEAFAGCTSLKVVRGSALVSIGRSAFAGCSSLKTVPMKLVRSMGSNAFSSCTCLKSVTAPQAKSIGDAAFSGCRSMKTIVLSNKKLNKIGSRAFFGCKRLKKLKISSKKLTAKRIGAQAFKGLPKSCRVYVAKSKKAVYKKIFIKKGFPKKFKIRSK